MKNITRYLLPIFILLCIAHNANASFLVRNATATTTTASAKDHAAVKSVQKIYHTENHIKQWLKWHPKIQFFSRSNGYKALMCGLMGLVILPMGVKAISYANATLHGDRQDVVMARAGKVLGIISYVLVIVGICGLLGWLAYKNPSFGQAMGQFLIQLAGDILEGLADNDN